MSRFIREKTQPPRASQFMAAHPGAFNPDRLQHVINTVWADLLLTLADPIHVVETECERVVEVLGCMRYCVSKTTGLIQAMTLALVDNHTVAFVPSKDHFAVDLPMKPTGAWMEEYLLRWRDQLDEVAIDSDRVELEEGWFVTAQRLFTQAMVRSAYWMRLRYAAREALNLDPRVLRWARCGRSKHDLRVISDAIYNRTIRHQAAYAQIERDNPNLVWLYTLMLDEAIVLPKGEAIAAMKEVLKRGQITEAGWRFLANGKEKDFRHIRDWIGEYGALKGRIFEIPAWLRLMVALRRKVGLPGAIQKIFLHDCFDKDRDGQVRFRNVWMAVPVLKIILDEAERRLARGSLQSFIQEDLVEVVTWLEAEQPTFDKNQLKAGWKHLADRTVEWTVQTEHAKSEWVSVLPEMSLRGWSVIALTDAWQLRQEALTMHHCADRYLTKCMVNSLRMFSIRKSCGKRVATVGLKRGGDKWQSFGIRAACNRPVSGSLIGLDVEIAQRYTDLWRATRPTPPTPLARPKVIKRASTARYDREVDNACPVCGLDGSECESHTVACYDLFGGGLVGGELYDRFDSMVDTLRTIFAQALAAGHDDLGLGDELNTVLGTLRSEVLKEVDIGDALNVLSETVRTSLLDVLQEQGEVVCTRYDFDGGMPGMSTTYKTYWAGDPDAAVAQLEERLAEVKAWLDGCEESLGATGRAL